MSTTTATRAPRLRPPAAPTRTQVPRRRTSGEGAARLGRADRPVLRIVADDERAPVVTRVVPGAEEVARETVAPVEPRRVDLASFFAAEYDGDDQSLAVLPPRRSSVRLTRRGRLAILVVALTALLGLGLVAAAGSLAQGRPEPTRVVVVQPGQTLWGLASSVASRTGEPDVRAVMTRLERLNGLHTASLQVGQRLRVPR